MILLLQSAEKKKWKETLFYSQANFFSSWHILASTCCLIKPLVKNSKTHYCALYVKGLLSRGPVCMPLHSHQSSPCLQVPSPEHKRILVPRREKLLILREVSWDIQNGNGKRKGKSKASCSSYSTDEHRPDQTWTETWSFSVLCITQERFPSRRKKKSTHDSSLQRHHAEVLLQLPGSVSSGVKGKQGLPPTWPGMEPDAFTYSCSFYLCFWPIFMPNYLSDSFSILLISTAPFHRTVQRRSNAICTLKCKHHGFNTVCEMAKQKQVLWTHSNSALCNVMCYVQFGNR